VAEPQLATRCDDDPLDPPPAVVGAVGAAGVLEDPLAAFEAQHGMGPRDAVDGDHDVRARVPAHGVGTSWIQSDRDTVALHDKLSHKIAFPSLAPRGPWEPLIEERITWDRR
jgi:hypothetical protein